MRRIAETGQRRRDMKFLDLAPMLQTNDMRRTREWYESVLGFAAADFSDDSWSSLSRDNLTIMFMHDDQMGPPNATAIQYFYVDDAMALWTAIKDRCTIESPPEEMPYGVLEFTIKDPNGYLLSFGQEMQQQGSR
jgi:uncharacterized glyoxalase superfamily protein PhnB